MTSSDILAKLFNSGNRIRIIRLFLLNQDEIFVANDISRRAKVAGLAARREISVLNKIGFIIQKSEQKIIIPKKGLPAGRQGLSRRVKTGKPKRKKIKGWKLNDSFPLLAGLKNFILDAAPVSRDKLLKKIQKTGKVKLLILAGIFGQEDSSRVDILVVGDGIKRSALERVMRDLEAEVGKELVYAVFTTQDFMYRLGMYDKFIRDILYYSHEKLLDKLGI